AYTYEANLIRNKLWYRGEAYELEQFFKNISSDPVNQSRFWCATPSENLSIRKIHSGLPSMLIDKLTDIVVSDIDQIQVEDSETLNSLWKDISEDNKFNEILLDSIQKALVSGDGAFKLSIDTDISKYPIIEFFDGDRVEYIHNRGRLSEIHFKTSYTKKSKKYTLVEMYGLGYIKYKLLDGRDNEVSLDILDETKELEDVEYKDKFIMAIPLMFFKSSKWEGRGKSIIDNKSDSFDALDEVISQWIDAIRAGRVQRYIPENLLPVDPNTGKILKPNPFDNSFIATSSNAGEDAKNQIDMKQADIKFEAYVESYSNAIDMCLQGIISPSTLGIDL
ncbi:TPA: phage portal protein, partial [Clostridioides difficile]|nr:phage portal protein [Clostridioides difficile]